MTDLSPEQEYIATIEAYGGPVYPTKYALGAGGSYQHPGMTLRDWFAGQTLAGHLASLNPIAEHDPDSAAAFARSAYQIADAMLKERRS